MNHVESEKAEKQYDCNQYSKSFRKLSYVKDHVIGVHEKYSSFSVTNMTKIFFCKKHY